MSKPESKPDLATRRARCLHVSYDDLLQGFRRVGIHPGDTVYLPLLVEQVRLR